MRRRWINQLILPTGFVILCSVVLLPGCDFVEGDDDDDEVGIALELVADGFNHPVMMAESPDNTGRMFVVDQIGLISVILPDGTVEPFLDIQDRVVELNPGYDERGLLGFAFHPDYANNGRFFVYYSAPLAAGAPPDFNHTSHISEFTVMASDPNRADPNSERVLLTVDQPQSNHNAGTLAFGPDDGYLYVSLGDGGGANDVGIGHVEDWYDANEGGNAQDISQNLLGSIIRIDVDGGDPYGIPADNPFVGVDEALDEIYAYGFRNPYRFSFDIGGAHDLLVGDAGQNLWEEVSLVTRGGNYGWNVKEGAHCFDTAQPDASPDTCPEEVGDGHPDAGAPLIDPVIEFANSAQSGGLGQVVVGGHVYRGVEVPQLTGRYLFGVASRGGDLGGEVFVAQPAGAQPWTFASLRFTGGGSGAVNADGTLSDFLLSFAQDLDGEVYVLSAGNLGPSGTTGKVFRIVQGAGTPGNGSNEDDENTANGDGTGGGGTGGPYVQTE